MAEKILTRMVGYETSAQIWEAILDYYNVQNKSKLSQFKTQLKNVKKDSLFVGEYLLKIKTLVDLLGVNW